MTAACERDGCTARAEWTVVVEIPAQGWPFELHEPLAMVTSLRTCRRHAEDFDVPGMFLPETRDAVTAAMRAAKRCEPDFDRARSRPIRLDSAEYARFEKMLAGGREHG